MSLYFKKQSTTLSYEKNWYCSQIKTIIVDNKRNLRNFPKKHDKKNAYHFILINPAIIPTKSNKGHGINENKKVVTTGFLLKRTNNFLSVSILSNCLELYPAKYPVISPNATPKPQIIPTTIGEYIRENSATTKELDAGIIIVALDTKHARNIPIYPRLL